MKANPRQHFPALDGLRAVAVLLVLFVHAMPTLFPWGWLGVQIFFVLSGFLITGILFDSRERSTRYRDFYVRRALRIFPLYYIVLIVAALLTIHGTHPENFWLWFAYLQNFAWYLPSMRGFTDILIAHYHPVGAVGHFWSLAVEEQFYLIWPFIVFTVRSRKRLIQLCFAAISARLLLGFALQHWAPQGWLNAGLIYRMLPTQSDGFLMGALLALWLRASGTAAQHRLSALARLAPIAACGYGLLLAILHLRPMLGVGDVLDYRSPFQATLGLPLSNLASLCVIAAALVPGTAIYRFCSLSWLRNLGLISYGFYVFHLFILVIVRPYIDQATLRWHLSRFGVWQAFGACAITILVSYSSFRWIESPFLRLKDRLAPSHRSTPSGREATLVA